MSNHCRFCNNELRHSFCNLGMSPLSNAYLSTNKLQAMEAFYPLHAEVCSNCYLVQLPEFESPQNIFSDYAYFSSYSESWLAHSREYVSEMQTEFGIGSEHQVVEIASNDGYLLQYFAQNGTPVLGIEPAANVAEIARQKGVETLVEFFGVACAEKLVSKGLQADLLLGNNVAAHVPDINDFVGGMKRLLKLKGIITLEFPHLLRLIEDNQFDTIYHEHFSYLSLLSMEKILGQHQLKIFDVKRLSTHGGSLRLYVCHDHDLTRPISPRVEQLRSIELDGGLSKMETYTEFSAKVCATKRKLLEFLIAAKNANKHIVAYGAAAKGNTLLNYCGIREDFIDYVVDRSPHKQGLFLPGTHLPIHAPERIMETKPDIVLILPWNLKDEITGQMATIRKWGGQFLVPIPEPTLI